MATIWTVHMMLWLCFGLAVVYATDDKSCEILENSKLSMDFFTFEEPKNECRKLGHVIKPNDKLVSNKNDAIFIMVSDNPLHQIVSRIVGFYLNEIIGHTKVIIGQYLVWPSVTPTCHIYDQLQVLLLLSDYNISHVVVNVGLSQPREDIIDLPLVDELGTVGPVSRFDWFYPNYTLASELRLNELLFNKTFSIANDFLREFPTLTNIDTSKCAIIANDFDMKAHKSHVCHKFIPTNCANNNTDCFVLLSSYFSETSFIIRHISDFGMPLKVIWLHEHLLAAVNQLIENKQQFLLLVRNPSELTVDLTQLTIIPRSSYDLENEHSTAIREPDLAYANMKMFRYRPYSLRQPNHLNSILTSMQINNTQAMDLLQQLNEKMLSTNLSETRITDVYDAVACNNLHLIDNKTDHPAEAEFVAKIYMFHLENSTTLYEGLESVMARAIADIERSQILPKIKLRAVPIRNCTCKKFDVLYHLWPRVTETELLGVVGPTCSDAVHTIATIATTADIPVITYSAEGGSLADRDTYRYVFRTISDSNQYAPVFKELFRSFNWKRAAALSVQGSTYNEYIGQMNLGFVIDTKKLPLPLSSAKVREDLTELKRKHFKIIIADLDSSDTEHVFCEAFQLGMTAKQGYVWFLPDWIAKSWDHSATNYTTCTSGQVGEALDGHFAMSQVFYAPNSTVLPGNQTVGDLMEAMHLSKRALEAPSYLGFAYDAMWTYALALARCMETDQEFPIHMRKREEDLSRSVYMERLHSAIAATNFTGLSGAVSFGGKGSRVTDKYVLRRQNGTWITVYSFRDGQLYTEDPIDWINSPPTDGLAEANKWNDFIIICSVICVALLIALGACWFFRRKYRQKIKASAVLLRSFGLDMKIRKVTSTTDGTLRDWEISKENIRLNYKLGYGMFGVVLGGYVLINNDEDNPKWIPVAAKALRRSTSFDERLDFLSEAETMKRLDHPNIVKLIGVSLACDPIYTIMELMMHGDLQSYIQKRRHLVGHITNADEESEVSPKRLTKMVLDVACGLSYLAQQKFVHRDLASRNCLVTGLGQPIVKLGDFGMARPMFDNDHYRFRRKAQIPIRWSAPESLNLGIYTPASDVWSFGVVVYEIITFGMNPYWGMSDSDVIAHIKAGKCMQIPTAAKPQLEWLMTMCWKSDFKLRPRACEIVDYMADYPRLVTPCLDVTVDPEHTYILDDEELTSAGEFRRPATVEGNLHDGKQINYLDLSKADCLNSMPEWSGNVEPEWSGRVEPDEIRSRSEYMDMMNGDYNPVKPLLKKSNSAKKNNQPTTEGWMRRVWTSLSSFWNQTEVTHL